MRRLFRLVLLCLLALALPIQGAMAAAAVAGGHAMAHGDVVAADAAHAMAMADAAPCPHHPASPHAGHSLDRAGCGACCGPAVAQRPLLAVAPVAARWAPVHAEPESTQHPQFLTTGPDRPPRAA